MRDHRQTLYKVHGTADPETEDASVLFEAAAIFELVVSIATVTLIAAAAAAVVVSAVSRHHRPSPLS